MKAWAIQRKPHRGGKWEYFLNEWWHSEPSAHVSSATQECQYPHFKFRVVRIEITVVKEGE
jgi:hypothetical protein